MGKAMEFEFSSREMPEAARRNRRLQSLSGLLQPRVVERLLHRHQARLRVEGYELLAQVARKRERGPRVTLPVQDLRLQLVVNLPCLGTAHRAILKGGDGAPGRVACHQDVEDHAHRPEVRLRRGLAQQHLRRDVAGGAHEGLRLWRLGGPLYYGVKVNELHCLWGGWILVGRVEEDVLRLDVSMYHVVLVQVPDRGQDLLHYPLALLLRDLLSRRQEVEELAPVALRHHDVVGPVVL
mmetsp:Transcript_33172/g.95387  ORF Transcript_33172/g.95387 Transcript_33172/m.95387 type:complete len:238 (+) Transcript_33172:3-716(+)